MRNAFLFLMVVFFWVFSLATNVLASSSEITAVVNQAREASQAGKAVAYHEAKNFSPASVIDHYSDHPEQMKYYGEAGTSGMQAIESDAFNSRSNSEVGRVVSESITQSPRFVLKETDLDIAHSSLIEREANNIIHGVTSQYVDCKPKEECNIQYEDKRCDEVPHALLQSCQKTLHIDVVPRETVTHYPFFITVKTSEHRYAGVTVNLVTGKVAFIGPHDTTLVLNGRLPSGIDCRGLQGAVTVLNPHHRGTRLDYIHFPACSNDLALDFHVSGDKTIDLVLQVDVSSKVVTYDLNDRWTDDCAGVMADTICTLRSKTCAIPTSTQVVENIPVTRDCWQETFQYLCRQGISQKNCAPLQAQGCEQIGSDCVEKKEGQCTLYRQHYRCSTQSCAPTTDVVCGNGQEYCLDGDCTDRSYTQSTDFAKGVSALSAVSDAAKQYDPASFTLFSGHATECSEKPVGYSNCCTETGWGQDVGLDHCAEKAKRLQVSRHNKLAVKVGSYCSGPEPFPCIEHSQVFCVFNSKLAKIIQEKGRKDQLHIPFGSGKEPNCLGITPAQLQAIDFSKIDFQDFMADLNAKVKQPDGKLIQAHIEANVKQYQQTGQPHA